MRFLNALCRVREWCDTPLCPFILCIPRVRTKCTIRHLSPRRVIAITFM